MRIQENDREEVRTGSLPPPLPVSNSDVHRRPPISFTTKTWALPGQVIKSFWSNNAEPDAVHYCTVWSAVTRRHLAGASEHKNL